MRESETVGDVGQNLTPRQRESERESETVGNVGLDLTPRQRERERERERQWEMWDRISHIEWRKKR